MITLEKIVIKHIIVEGPDGAGKTTCIKQLQNVLPNTIVFSMGKVSALLDVESPSELNYLNPNFVNSKYNFTNHKILEQSLHLYRNSITIAEISKKINNLIDTATQNNQTSIEINIIQDRSWISSVIYNGIDLHHAYENFSQLLLELKTDLLHKTKILDYSIVYWYIYATLRELMDRRNSRGTTDVYEDKYTSEKLLSDYNDLFDFLETGSLKNEIKVIRYYNEHSAIIDVEKLLKNLI